MATISLSEIFNKATQLPTKQEQIEWLKQHNGEALRALITVMYDKKNFKWNIPSHSIPPYTPSVQIESHGMLYRQSRKLRYFIEGYDGDNLTQYRREMLFIEMLESIDKDDAIFMEKVLLQEPPKELPIDVINEALGLNITTEAEVKPETKKRGRKPKNV